MSWFSADKAKKLVKIRSNVANARRFRFRFRFRSSVQTVTAARGKDATLQALVRRLVYISSDSQSSPSSSSQPFETRTSEHRQVHSRRAPRDRLLTAMEAGLRFLRTQDFTSGHPYISSENRNFKFKSKKLPHSKCRSVSSAIALRS